MPRKKAQISPGAVRVLLQQGLTYKQCANALGVSDDTMARRRKEEPDLEQACLEGKAVGVQKITNALFKAGMGGNVTAMIFYLKNQAGWKDRVEGFDGDITKTYVIMGSQPAETVESWVDKHKPQHLSPPIQQ